ncbi:uncharacterized protein DNG_02795 [Cephalotrichum gorgonifer]|uniref:HpcH/HpaI aldolase/citrate lyase domain-containing protein n=1 Tax=Cephalotrichum gorgonifer TaxID=2041049 RepID=A0AAE8MU68_9PEZI|nr:uncharacterized protein DNG_02795 [Cephalotrichum gorgonifer]
MADKSYLGQPELHTRAEHRAALLTYPGNLQEAFRQAQADPKKTLLGASQGIPSTFVTKVIASAKPDFIWFDVEHGIYDRSTLYNSIHAAQHHSEGRTMALVRVPAHDEISLATALDAGASGIIFPNMQTVEDVRDMIKKVYYPPIGNRGFSPWVFTPGISDASLYSEDLFNMKSSNKHVCIIPQIESIKGMANIEDIAAIPEVSALMFGPGDYSADAGLDLTVNGAPHPDLLAAITKFIATGKKYNKPLLGTAHSPAAVEMMLASGYTAVSVLFDAWSLAGAVNDGMRAARDILEKDNKEGTTELVNGKAPHS